MHFLMIDITGNHFSPKIALVGFYRVVVNIVPNDGRPAGPNKAQRKSSCAAEEVNKLSRKRNVFRNLIGKQRRHGVSNLVVDCPQGPDEFKGIRETLETRRFSLR